MAKRSLVQAFNDVSNTRIPLPPVSRGLLHLRTFAVEFVTQLLQWSACWPTFVRWGSLVLAIAAVSLTLAQEFTLDRVWHLGNGRWLANDSYLGLCLSETDVTSAGWATAYPTAFQWWRSEGYKYPRMLTIRRSTLVLPTLACTGLAILAWLGRLSARRHAQRLGKCPNCLYDRAGLAPEATCPECGATPLATKR